MKQIKVDCCKNCPYYYEQLVILDKPKDYCQHPAVGLKNLNNVYRIDKYCPLEDIK
jgi:hypothetical protein